MDLIRRVGYAFLFCFPFSMREKTRAYHRLVDDVSPTVKLQRLEQLRQLNRQSSLKFNQAQIGRVQLILIEGQSRRSPDFVYGRNDFNIKVIVPRTATPLSVAAATDDDPNMLSPVTLQPGNYCAVQHSTDLFVQFSAIIAATRSRTCVCSTAARKAD
ncbi:unnamed protein product [Echinostoma caproni]|uniref:Uncharacterized protein n=1 Tax=Echinostoma caproni TaxID=27848 RepID=A0A3P8IPQ4_9TREM|nr:unnamed protein product [Echinostoma caproni]